MACNFHLILDGIPSSLLLSVKNRRTWGGGRGGVLLHGQIVKRDRSYLSLTKTAFSSSSYS